MRRSVGHFTARAVLLGIIISAGASASDRTPSGLSVASPTLEVDFPAEGSLLQFFGVPQEGQEELNHRRIPDLSDNRSGPHFLPGDARSRGRHGGNRHVF